MALVAFETLLTPVEVADSWRPPLDGLDESDSPNKKNYDVSFIRETSIVKN